MCESFGPPSRALRWCCTIFKTGFIGEKIKMTNEAVYDKDLWNNTQNGMGSVGGRLIENGEERASQIDDLYNYFIMNAKEYSKY
mgnify:CR=1 FL=1